MSGLRVSLALVLAASLVLVAVPVSGAQEVDLTGTWNLTMVVGDPDERTRGTLRLEQEGTTLTGVWSREDQVDAEMEVSGAVDGATVRFSWDVAEGTTVSFVGEVREDDANTMAGTFEIGDQVSGEWTARKTGPRKR